MDICKSESCFLSCISKKKIGRLWLKISAYSVFTILMKPHGYDYFMAVSSTGCWRKNSHPTNEGAITSAVPIVLL